MLALANFMKGVKETMGDAEFGGLAALQVEHGAHQLQSLGAIAYKDATSAMKVVDPLVQQVGAAGLETDEQIAKVSVVGAVMHRASGYAARTFEALHAAGVNVDMITTSEIRISCIIHADNTTKAVLALHKAFALESIDQNLED